jgi:hypothetical protein
MTSNGDPRDSSGGEPRLEAPEPATARIGISAVAPSCSDGGDALALLLDVGDANDTGWLQRGRAPEFGRRHAVARVR